MTRREYAPDIPEKRRDIRANASCGCEAKHPYEIPEKLSPSGRTSAPEFRRCASRLLGLDSTLRSPCYRYMTRCRRFGFSAGDAVMITTQMVGVKACRAQ